MFEAVYIYRAVRSGYYLEKDWKKWGDEEILSKDEVEEWIYDVAFARTKELLYSAVYDKRIYESDDYDDEDIIAGYYYLLYLERKLSFENLISKLSDEDDPTYGAEVRDKEAFYTLDKQIRQDSSILQDNKIIKRVCDLLEPYAKIAQEQQRMLNIH